MNIIRATVEDLPEVETVGVRLLGAGEFELLDAIPEPDRVKLDPSSSIVAVAIKHDKLVGRLAALSLPHIECAWIDESHRNNSILWRLERLLVAELKRQGAELVFAFAVDETMEDYCRRLGYEKCATVWKKGV